ncbi:MAG: outer membrane protein assembly factor BamD [Phycisphaerae bacterium]
MNTSRRATVFSICLLAITLAAAARAEDAPRGRGSLRYDAQRGEWIEVAVAEPGTPAGDLQLAQERMAQRDYAAARKSIAAWLKACPDDALRPDALLTAGDIELHAADAGQRADVWRAHEQYEEILNAHAGAAAFDKALRRELLVAEMFLFKGHKRPILRGMLRVSAEDEALTILDRLINERAPGTLIAEAALLMQADYHYQHGEFEAAEKAYARLSTDFPRGRHLRLAMQRSADAALAGFAGVNFDDAPLLEAEERYRQYAERYEQAAREEGVANQLARIRDSRAQKEYTIGQYYDRARQPRAAAFYYRSVVKNWPDTPWANLAQQRLDVVAPGQAAPPLSPSGAAPASEVSPPPVGEAPASAPRAAAIPASAPPTPGTIETIQPVETTGGSPAPAPSPAAPAAPPAPATPAPAPTGSSSADEPEVIQPVEP